MTKLTTTSGKARLGSTLSSPCAAPPTRPLPACPDPALCGTPPRTFLRFLASTDPTSPRPPPCPPSYVLPCLMRVVAASFRSRLSRFPACSLTTSSLQSPKKSLGPPTPLGS